MASPREYFYPEAGAGGYSRVDTTVEFYQRVNSLLAPSMTVVDFGAGRGRFTEGENQFKRELQMVRGKVARVVGLDVDPAVMRNASVDEAYVITLGQPLPVETGRVDLVVCDWVLEHVSDPAWLAEEVHRILRPGGWFCARTPNKWGYIGVAARLVPNRLHVRALRVFQPEKRAYDTFPVAYRLNTRRAIHRWFERARFTHHTYSANGEPAYFANRRWAWRLALLVFRLLPPQLGAVLFVFIQKKQR